MPGHEVVMATKTTNVVFGSAALNGLVPRKLHLFGESERSGITFLRVGGLATGLPWEAYEDYSHYIANTKFPYNQLRFSSQAYAYMYELRSPLCKRSSRELQSYYSFHNQATAREFPTHTVLLNSHTRKKVGSHPRSRRLNLSSFNSIPSFTLGTTYDEISIIYFSHLVTNFKSRRHIQLLNI